MDKLDLTVSNETLESTQSRDEQSNPNFIFFENARFSKIVVLVVYALKRKKFQPSKKVEKHSMQRFEALNFSFNIFLRSEFRKLFIDHVNNFSPLPSPLPTAPRG